MKITVHGIGKLSVQGDKHFADVLEKMGAKNISTSVSSSPPTNLMAGGCRFGNDPQTSVLNKNCRAHEVVNLYVTDGSFMPTGGSVPYTYTIYANAFRVADHIIQQWQKSLGSAQCAHSANKINASKFVY